jgi:hypothetical protein
MSQAKHKLKQAILLTVDGHLFFLIYELKLGIEILVSFMPSNNGIMIFEALRNGEQDVCISVKPKRFLFEKLVVRAC